MKITMLLFPLVLGYMVPAYSQIEHHRADSTIRLFSIFPTEKFGVIGKISDESIGSSNDWRLHNQFALKSKSLLSAHRSAEYSVVDMPCLKPDGRFFMRVYEPDSTVTYAILRRNY